MTSKWVFSSLPGIKRLITDSQRGSLLLGVLIALGIMGICAVPFLSALTTSVEGGALAEEMVDVDSIARAQMEYTKNSVYVYETAPGVHPGYGETDIVIPASYDIDVEAQALNSPDDGIQLITVTVSKDSNSLLALKGYKVDR